MKTDIIRHSDYFALATFLVCHDLESEHFTAVHCN